MTLPFTSEKWSWIVSLCKGESRFFECFEVELNVRLLVYVRLSGS